ncbi:MAG: hypothetical protein ACE5KA_03990, partial [Nitrososphaerales archaeon]
SSKKLMIIGIVIVAGFAIGIAYASSLEGGPFSLTSDSSFLSEKEKEETANEPMVIHIHAAVRILIYGEPVIIPKHIGIDPSLYNSHDLDQYGIKEPKTYPLHTHDTSGVIHIESSELRTFTLGQFFDVWGVPFDQNCVMDKCNTSMDKVRMYVDGNETFEFREHIFKDRDEITIEFGASKGEYKF